MIPVRRRLLKWSIALACIFLAAKPVAGQGGCPPTYLTFYYDSALHMIFGGTSSLAGTAADGSYVYLFRGRNLPNEMAVTAYHRVSASQCRDAWLSLDFGFPAEILQFYQEYPKYDMPRFRSVPPNVACNSGGEGGQYEGETRNVPTARFDCVLEGGDGTGSTSGDGSWHGLVTVSTCHYSAHFDGNGNYLYSELEYCEESTYQV